MVREKVLQGASWYVYSFQELIDELESEDAGVGDTDSEGISLTQMGVVSCSEMCNHEQA